MSANESKDQERVAGGYKATLHNPRVSDEAKERAGQKLEEMGVDSDRKDDKSSGFDDANKNEGNVIGGYKATLKNPRVSDEAKQHAEQVLRDHDAL